MPRNSWAPLIGLVVAMGVGLLLLEPSAPAGHEGPVLAPGAFPVTDRWRPGPEAGLLRMDVQLTASPDSLALDPAVDRRSGLEVVPWDQIALSVEDYHPITRSLARGLAEHLTGHLTENGAASPVGMDDRARLVYFVLREDSGLSMPMRQLLSLRLIEESGERGPGGTYRCLLQLSLRDTHRPEVDAASHLLPAGGIAEGDWRLAAEIRADPSATWAEWHIGAGRELAAAVLRTLPAQELAWDEPEDPRQRMLARTTSGYYGPEWAEYASMTWSGAIDTPPKEGVERWTACFQAPLVRGWLGQIWGHQVTRKGETKATLELFKDKIKGADRTWAPAMEIDGGWAWDAKPTANFDHLQARPRPWGTLLAVHRRFAEPDRTLMLWLDLAASGQIQARHQLRRHLFCSGLDPQRLREAAAFLRQDPDAADLAALGSLPDAAPAERQAATVIAWLRGIGKESALPDLTGLPELAAEPIAWDSRPRLFQHAGAPVLLIRAADGRWSCYHRSAGGPPRWHSHRAADARSDLAPGTALVVERSAGQTAAAVSIRTTPQ